jgi:hypothetical protein
MAVTYTTTHAGHTATRKSAGHTEQQYHFAVWCADKGQSNWTCEAYASRRDLAEARVREFSGWRRECDFVIALVTAEIKLTKKQVLWAEICAGPGTPEEKVQRYNAAIGR